MATVDAKRDKSLEGSQPQAEHVVEAPSKEGLDLTVDAARAANDGEHALTVKDALKIHWKAVIWSLLVSMSIIMEGYDTSLIFNFFAYPAYKRQFGVADANGDFQVQGKWQSALGSVSTAG